MKSVLFISRTAGCDYGGMQTYTKSLLHGFSKSKDITISTCFHSGSSLFLPLYFFRALGAIIFTSADTVLVGDGLLSPLLVFVRIFRPHMKRVVIVYGLDLTWGFFGYRRVIRYALHFADEIVAISRFTAELTRGLGVAESRIHVIPCPVLLPSKIEKTIRKPYQLLFVGRLIERKGVCWFLECVFPRLCARFPEMTLVIAGDGPERSAIDALLRRCFSSDQTSLRGCVSEEEKWRLFSESTLLIVPNILCKNDPEGFGIVCLEAAGVGLPTVASRVDGLTDAVVEGVTGSFFETASEQECIGVIEEALQKTWDSEMMKAVVHSRFSPTSIADRFYHDVF
jgi:phosphatidyl-myo-inositol dimannoside synthase